MMVLALVLGDVFEKPSIHLVGGFNPGSVLSNSCYSLVLFWSCLHYTQGCSYVLSGTNLRLENTYDHA